ncbi:MAG: transglycosylase SLT domain-containing protein [Microthrixaceae bacterium]
MSIARRTFACFAILFAVLAVASGCTPEQIAWWNDPTVPQSTKDAIWRAMTTPPPARDCNEAIDQHWPGDKAWAKRIVWRESRNTPTARNASGASGCFQLMLPLHSRLFTAAGFSPSQWSDPVVNTKVAWSLYRSSGTSPWVLTNY